MPRPIQCVNTTAFGTEVILVSYPTGADWWDPDNDGLCIVAAYRAINTPGNPWPNDAPANYAATLVNNANPGVNNLVEGNGGVPWAANTGWQFAEAALQYFLTGFVPQVDQSQSAACQYANVGGTPGQWLLGSFNWGNSYFGFQPDPGSALARCNNGAIAQAPPQILTGNLALAGNAGYRNGINEGYAIGPYNQPTAREAYIGCFNSVSVGGATGYITAEIRAVALYDCVLIGPQISAIATAMSQL